MARHEIENVQLQAEVATLELELQILEALVAMHSTCCDEAHEDSETQHGGQLLVNSLQLAGTGQGDVGSVLTERLERMFTHASGSLVTQAAQLAIERRANRNPTCPIERLRHSQNGPRCPVPPAYCLSWLKHLTLGWELPGDTSLDSNSIFVTDVGMLPSPRSNPLTYRKEPYMRPGVLFRYSLTRYGAFLESQENPGPPETRTYVLTPQNPRKKQKRSVQDQESEGREPGPRPPASSLGAHAGRPWSV